MFCPHVSQRRCYTDTLTRSLENRCTCDTGGGGVAVESKDTEGYSDNRGFPELCTYYVCSTLQSLVVLYTYVVHMVGGYCIGRWGCLYLILITAGAHRTPEPQQAGL